MSEAAGPSKKSQNIPFPCRMQSFSKCICLICQSTITTLRRGNAERHFQTAHKKCNTDFPPKSALSRRKVRELRSQLIGCFSHRNSQAKADTKAWLRVSHSILSIRSASKMER